LPGLNDGQGLEFVRLLKGHEEDQKRTAFINIPYDWLGFNVDLPELLRSFKAAHLVLCTKKNQVEGLVHLALVSG
jgi:hypothetical protein